MPNRATLLAIGAALSTFSGAPAAQAQDWRAFDVPAQPAAAGLRRFSRQAGIQVLVSGDAARGRQTARVRGRMPVRTALDHLLAGSGLRVLSFDGSLAVLAIDTRPPVVADPEPIVITGSRIPQARTGSAMPVRVVKFEAEARFGRNSAYDVLTREASVAAGIGLNNAFGQPWDAGVSSVSLRGLGPNRSLTLIDGMRRVSGSARSSAVDITMIPAVMIDRIEVITGGATAIYGADAVTGAVNIVTKKRVEGVTLSATQGVSERGDAGERAISLSAGAGFADGRGSLVLGGTYSRVAPLAYAQRYNSYLRSVANPDNKGANDGIPDQVTIADFRQIYFSYLPSFYVAGQSYIVEGGVPRPAAYDRSYYPGQFSYGNGGDGRNLRDADQLRGGLDAIAALGRLDYALSDTLTYRGYADLGGSDYRGTASFPLHRDDSRTTWFTGAGGAVARLDNPFLPDGVRRFMADNGLAAIGIDRTYGNFPVMRETHRRRTLTVGQQLDGDLGQAFRWSAFHQYGRMTDDVRTTNNPVASHWLAARDAIADPATGRPVCRDPAARAAGCVPLDIFSQAPPSRALAGYVLGTRKERRLNTQAIWGLSLLGRAVSLPHGDVQAVLGVEHRREALRTRDDPLAASEYAYGGSGYTVHPDLAAEQRVWEAYGEAKVPLLRDLPFARSLDLEGAYRASRYNSIGSTGTWKLGGTWSPSRGMMFRAMGSRSVRVPNFGELYEVPILRQTGSITDPCEAADYYQNPTRSANCRALGIVVPLGDFKVGPVVTTRGNPDLRPETSNSLTLGGVLRPGFLPGAEFTLDYWNIDIRDAVTQFDYTTVLNLCVDLPSIANPFCAAVTRDPATGSATSIATSQVNASRMVARGLDFGLAYENERSGGQLSLELNGTYLLRHIVQSAPGLVVGDVRYDGDWQHPKLQASGQASWRGRRVGVGLSLRFIGASRYDISAASDEVYDRNRLPPYLYADLTASHDFPGGMMLSAGVRNATNQRPPRIYPVYKDTAIYDQVGRYFFVSSKLKL
ncbi:TonB-dependent receptor [Sphingomonas sp. S2-65]|uniref:TonB-dependent receptor n=1 Tax=Sphingomonas sp. S2-65 TaxID=2903960 RepID=UPI001F2C420E|nr:TonB-dependent receptor [Sphingomonas sp. S2-65]UYY59504.1 TonB-dependent receptor [Sphingomonas sp. S2-65]